MAQVAAAPGHTERADRGRQLQTALMAVAVAIGVALRWVGLGDAIPTFDETFGARISRLPLGDMFAYLREYDWHPPLDYFVRRPSVLTDSAFLLRAPSALAGTATLLAVMVWMRRERWLGVVVVVLTSLSTIQILYARTARMYAFLILGGTLLAIFSDRWLDRPRTRWAVAAGITVFIAALSQQVILFMVPGLLLVAGLRRDRQAWVWRGWMVGGALAWFAVWGPTLLHQMGSHVARVKWIPLTTPGGIYDAVTGQLTLSPALQPLVFAGTVGGGVLLWRRHRRLGQVWLYVLVLPAVLVMLAGFQLHLLLPRSISFAALAPVLSFAAIVDWLVEDPPAVLGRLVPIPLAVTIVAVGAASAWSAHSFEEDFAPTRRELIARAQPGDVVAAHPRFLGDVLQWDFDLPREPIAVDGLDPATTWAGRLPGEPTGRLWMIVPDTYGRPELIRSARPCDGPAPSGQPPLLLHCVEGVG